jgi:hypothetical protein
MVAEGVDIQRVRVIVYLSSTMTEMWFRQIVGRAVRMQDASHIKGDQWAKVFIPMVPALVAMAQGIKEDVDWAVRETEDRPNPIRRSPAQNDEDVLAPTFIVHGSTDERSEGVIAATGERETEEVTEEELAEEGLPKNRPCLGARRPAHRRPVAARPQRQLYEERQGLLDEERRGRRSVTLPPNIKEAARRRAAQFGLTPEEVLEIYFQVDRAERLKAHERNTETLRTAPIEVICANCGEKFERRYKNKTNPPRFCSIKCSGEYQSKDPARHQQKKPDRKAVCAQCGKEFEYPKNGRPRRFCGVECYNAFRYGKPEESRFGVCIICNQEFKRVPGTRNKPLQRMCSDKCFRAYRRGRPLSRLKREDGTERRMDGRARRAATRAGLIARRSRQPLGIDNEGRFMLVNDRNLCVAGPKFNMTAEEVIAYCCEKLESSNDRQDPNRPRGRSELRPCQRQLHRRWLHRR